MKTSALIAFILTAVFSSFGQSQAQAEVSSTRLDSTANQLKRTTLELVDRTSGELKRGNPMSRTELEAAFLAHQLDASAGFFQQLVRDNRRAPELRDGAAILNELVRRSPLGGSAGDLWRSAQNSINQLNRELGGSTAGSTGENTGGNTGSGDGGPTENRSTTGRVYWRGMVDDKIQLVIRERRIETRVVSGRAYPDGTFSFTAALPSADSTVEVNKTKGRGTARVVQQPDRSNDFTAIIEISDTDGGAKEYQLDISWK